MSEIVLISEILNENIKAGIFLEQNKGDFQIPVVKTKDIIRNELIHINNLKKVAIEKSKLSDYLLKNGDLLISRHFSSNRNRFCSIFQEDKNRAIFDRNVYRVRINTKKANELYIFYFLQSTLALERIRKLFGYSLRTYLKASDIENIKVIIPPLEEQNNLVNRISVIDRRISTNKMIISKFSSFGTLLFRNYYKSIRQGNTVKLGEITKIQRGITPKRIFDDFKTSLLPIIRITRVINQKKISFANPEGHIIVDKKEPIIILDGPSVGMVKIGYNGILSSGLAKITSLSNNIDNSFFYFFLKSNKELLKKISVATTISHLRLTDIKSINIINPETVNLEKMKTILSKILNFILLKKDENLILVKMRNILLNNFINEKNKLVSNYAS